MAKSDLHLATEAELERIWRALVAERGERDRAIKRLGDALTEQLEQIETELHQRITTVHEQAIRELTRLHSAGGTK